MKKVSRVFGCYFFTVLGGRVAGRRRRRLPVGLLWLRLLRPRLAVVLAVLLVLSRGAVEGEVAALLLADLGPVETADPPAALTHAGHAGLTCT